MALPQRSVLMHNNVALNTRLIFAWGVTGVRAIPMHGEKAVCETAQEE